MTTNADNGPGSLRQAVIDACPGSTITFAGSVVSPIALTSGEITIDKNLTIQGPGASQLTVSGSNASRVFFIDTGNTVTLDGLTVSGGNGAGAIFSGRGGGIFNQGMLTLTNSTVSGNSTGFSGGGISNLLGTMMVTNSTVSGNSAGNIGGGIGGGILNDFGTLTVTNSTVSGNSADFGGGISSGPLASTLTLTNTTVSGNSASVHAGGISSAGPMTVTNSTVTGNRADSDGDASGVGGGIVADNGIETLNNTIVAANFRGPGTFAGNDDIFGPIETANNNLIGDAATSGGITDGTFGNKVGNNGTGTLDINTVLNTTLAFNGGPTMTHALICDSPALDAGSNTFAAGLTTDQRGAGFPRIFNDIVDIGAFEFQQICNTPPTITGETISRQQGSPASNSKIATVSDAEDAENLLTVTVNGGASATANSVTVSNIAVDASGNVTADVVADCLATDASFTLRVTDSGGLYNEDTLNVTVTANTPPTLSYSNSSVLLGGTTSVSPATVPSDNGSITGYAVQSVVPALTTAPTVNASGVVSITNAAPIGSHTITIRATDNCNQITNASFTLTVNSNKAADLELKKSDSPDPVLLNGNIVYTLEVENEGPGDATGVTITDVLPAGVSYVSAPGCTFASNTVTCIIGSLKKDKEAKRTITVKANALGTITNTASVKADQPDPKSSNNSDSTQTRVVIGVASLTLSPTSVKGGSSVVVTGTVTLSGPAPSGGQVVTLSSSSTSVAKPAVNSITIPFNQTSGTFTVKHFKVSSTKTAKIKASANGFSKEATLTVTKN